MQKPKKIRHNLCFSLSLEFVKFVAAKSNMCLLKEISVTTSAIQKPHPTRMFTMKLKMIKKIFSPLLKGNLDLMLLMHSSSSGEDSKPILKTSITLNSQFTSSIQNSQIHDSYSYLSNNSLRCIT